MRVCKQHGLPNPDRRFPGAWMPVSESVGPSGPDPLKHSFVQTTHLHDVEENGEL